MKYVLVFMAICVWCLLAIVADSIRFIWELNFKNSLVKATYKAIVTGDFTYIEKVTKLNPNNRKC